MLKHILTLIREVIRLLEKNNAAALRHGGHRGRRGARTTSDNLALPAVGNGVGVLIRPSLTPSASLRACGSAWSLADITSPHTPLMGEFEIKK